MLQKPLGRFRDIARPKRPKRRPLVLSKGEVKQILEVMSGTINYWSAPFRFGDAVARMSWLRIKDIDLALNQIVVRDGKGWKDRATMLPQKGEAGIAAFLRDPVPWRWLRIRTVQELL